MKTLLTILLLISAAANIILLSGCESVTGEVVFAPQPFRTSDIDSKRDNESELDIIRRAIPADYLSKFDRLNAYAESQQGKTVVVIDSKLTNDCDKIELFVWKDNVCHEQE